MISLHPSVICSAKRCVAGSCVAIASILPALWHAEAFARPPVFDGFPARSEQRSGGERRDDLRQSLSPQGDRAEHSGERRKLSSEERDALRRDLRAATRGAYRDEPGARRRD